jgi:hypothetical protein
MARFPWTRSLALMSALALTACGDDTKTNPSGGSGDDDDTADTATDTAGSGTGTDSGTGGGGNDTGSGSGNDTGAGTDTDTGGSSAVLMLDNPGDLLTFYDGSATQQIELADASGESNADQDFYLVLVNTAESDIGYRLRTRLGEAPAPPPSARPRPLTRPHARPAPFRRANPGAPPPLDQADVGRMRDEFLVRSNLMDSGEYAIVNATLQALGDNVSIWVDDDVAIDIDIGCDGDVDIPHPYDAYGFDNCDLVNVADILDTNVIPNVRELYGEESDVDGDGRVAIVITPVLNAITLTSSEESDHSKILASFAEPGVDLQAFDARLNPGSDEAEVIYVFAPDPYGFFNPNTGPTVEDFISYRLAGEAARAFTSLVAYNKKVILNESSPEEDWVIDVLGTFAADYCGFGATFYPEAWTYLDAPNLYPLMAEATGAMASLERGAQYLFGRWIFDQAVHEGVLGEDLLRDVLDRTETGQEAFEGATEDMLGMGLAELTVRWHLALLTAGRTTAQGNPLLDTSTFAPYAATYRLEAPPIAPRGFYGANGYQIGFDPAGLNEAWSGGTTNVPSLLGAYNVRTGNTDAVTYTPGFEFNGYVAKNHGVHVVRLVDLAYDLTRLELQASGEGLVGAVLRAPDPVSPDWAVENIFSATEVNAVALPALPDDGRPIYGLGRISDPGTTYIPGGTPEEGTVHDTDRWTLDLRDRPVGSLVHVAAWLERHHVDSSGTLGPQDPWIAIVPSELVPRPTVQGTSSASCPEGDTFQFPTSVLEHLYTQVFLSNVLYPERDESTVDNFDACGEPATADTGDTGPTLPACAEDWDRDTVPNSLEPTPTNVRDQLRVMECTLNGGTAPDTSVIQRRNFDMDELDNDEEASFDLLANAGGTTDLRSEDGYVSLTLTGGRSWTILVGASAGTGPYELTVKEIAR